MKKIPTLLFALLFANGLLAQSFTDTVMLNKIIAESQNNSQALATLSMLTDVHAPRLTGSPAYLKGAKWAKEQLEAWECDEVWMEAFEFPYPGWEAKSYFLDMVAPRFKSIIAVPAAWTGSTNGTIEGRPIAVDFMNIEEMKKWVGKLEGKILIFPESEDRLNFFTEKITDEEIAAAENYKFESDSARYIPDGLLQKMAELPSLDTRLNTVFKFLEKEKVAGVIYPSVYDNNVVKIALMDFFGFQETTPIPWLYITKEAHGQIMRLIEMDKSPLLQLNLQTEFYEQPENNINLIASLKGTDFEIGDEIVMAGAHLDTWHGSDGAADNSAGVAVMMEAIRILKALDVKPKRTIQIALWGGEEQGLIGSKSYVQQHLKNLKTGKLQKGHDNFVAYYNIDTGGGKIRGIYTQGNDKAAATLLPQTAPFKGWDLDVITTELSGGSDHVMFDAADVASFDYWQDPLTYWSLQHHTNLDVLELIPEENLKTNAIIVAYHLYCAAMQEERFPRKTDFYKR